MVVPFVSGKMLRGAGRAASAADEVLDGTQGALDVVEAGVRATDTFGSSQLAVKLGLRSFTSSNYRDALRKFTRFSGEGHQAHHIFPQKFEKDFNRIFAGTDFSIHDPRFMSWWEETSHLESAYAYNKAWETWLAGKRNASPEEALTFARELMREFGVNVDF